MGPGLGARIISARLDGRRHAECETFPVLFPREIVSHRPLPLTPNFVFTGPREMT